MTLRVTFTYIAPELRVSAQQPVADAAYLQPTSGATWVQMVTTVVIDARGLNKYLHETLHPADAAYIAFTKALADTGMAVDALQPFHFTKALADSTVTAESLWFALTRQLSDAVGTADIPVVSTTKSLADAVDAPLDQMVRSLTKVLADNAAVTDDMDGVTAGDQVDYLFSKVMGDAVGTADADTVTLTKALADTSGTADSGSIFFINYADSSYFAEQYVGTTHSI